MGTDARQAHGHWLCSTVKLAAYLHFELQQVKRDTKQQQQTKKTHLTETIETAAVDEWNGATIQHQSTQWLNYTAKTDKDKTHRPRKIKEKTDTCVCARVLVLPQRLSFARHPTNPHSQLLAACVVLAVLHRLFAFVTRQPPNVPVAVVRLVQAKSEFPFHRQPAHPKRPNQHSKQTLDLCQHAQGAVEVDFAVVARVCVAVCVHDLSVHRQCSCCAGTGLKCRRLTLRLHIR